MNTGTVHVPLKNGGFALVDASDVGLVSEMEWFRVSPKKASTQYAMSKHCGRMFWMHRLILGETNGIVDHRDRNGLNNSRSNLRVVTNSQNQQNKGRQKKFGKYKGARWHSRGRYWYATICHNGKHHWLGTFNDEVDAARAYDAAAIRLFGEHACCNFYGTPATHCHEYPKSPPKVRYPWKSWMNGEKHRIVKGVDFNAKIGNMLSLMYYHARKRHIGVKAHVDGEAIEFRFFVRDPSGMSN